MRVGRVTMLIIVAALNGVLPIPMLLKLNAGAQVHYKKIWEFKVQDGTLHVALVIPKEFESTPSPPVLEISYEGEPHPSLAEEAGFLREVLHDLPSVGADPHALSAIYMRGPIEPEVKRRLAITALHSQEWRNFITKGFGNPELIVDHLLNSLRAYDAFNAALEEYGLQVKTVGAEKSASAKCLDLKIPDLPCSVRHNPRVPAGASLSIILERGKGSAPK